MPQNDNQGERVPQNDNQGERVPQNDNQGERAGRRMIIGEGDHLGFSPSMDGYCLGFFWTQLRGSIIITLA